MLTEPLELLIPEGVEAEDITVAATEGVMAVQV